MPKHQHHLNCEAPICMTDPTPNWKKNVLWYPGELVCGKVPYTKIQKIQNRINRRFFKETMKDPYSCFTGEDLENIFAVTNSTYGRNPGGKGFIKTQIPQKNAFPMRRTKTLNHLSST